MGFFELIMQKRMLVAMMCSSTDKGWDFHAMVWQSYSELIIAFVHFTYIRDIPIPIFWINKWLLALSPLVHFFELHTVIQSRDDLSTFQRRRWL